MSFPSLARAALLRASLCPALVAMLLTTPAAAIEGVIGINQVQALAGGVTPGDAAGFPVTISSSGSYILTGNLTVADLDTSAIVVTSTDGITLDLNGFTIRGACPIPAGCSAGAGPSIGVDARSSNGTEVRNGRVRGFGSDGIASGTQSRISELFVEGNGGAGIAAASGSEIRDSRAWDNAGTGIVVTGSTVRSCSAEANLDGIVLGQLSMAVGNTVVGNARLGILVNGSAATVRGNVVSGNGTDGIAVTQSGSLIIGNVTNNNVSAGVAVLASGSVQRNVSVGNALGLYLVPESGGNAAAYLGNSVAGNGLASVSGGIQISPNSCNTTATCP